MKLTVTRKETPKLKAFKKREWAVANIEHYGKNPGWSFKQFLITSFDKEGKITGSLKLSVDNDVAKIDTVIVGKNSQGKGIGKKLMLKAEVICHKNKAHKIYLETGKNWKSVEFYEKLGYKKTVDLPNHFHHHDFILMTKFI